MAMTLKSELFSRFGKIEENMLISQATLLDPRFKKFTFSNKNNCHAAVSFLKAKAQSIIIEPEVLISKHTATTLSSTINSSSALWKEFDETAVNLIGGSNSSAAGIIEVDKYLNEPLISRTENPLVWWAERKKVYPRLYELVKRRLCIMATSVPCERIFSKAGQVISKKRSRLSTSKISQILFINHNI
ncbi:zinc finger BED domain-containing protein 4-like [Daktulosphaira vitifoliae]|uniref:zinc finger BED domain-containing protein 4-like n=1 Tax=Daktulosphaira vitifoliae TaxID=58002 RepID=UPI0021AA34DD|nr:zinc finger BED domain-containing protein 4-like [Daktulosphaira vitifoliae]